MELYYSTGIFFVLYFVNENLLHYVKRIMHLLELYYITLMALHDIMLMEICYIF